MFTGKLQYLCIMSGLLILIQTTQLSANQSSSNATITAATIKDWSEPKLSSEIKKHNRLYWEEQSPIITDEEYDILIERLKELNQDNPLVSHTGTAVKPNKTVDLEKPMLSLQKAYYFNNAPENKLSVMSWAEKARRSNNELFMIQPKYDGIAADYNKGILSTRGNGHTGQNISNMLPLVELKTKDYTGKINRNVRGELIIKNDDYRKNYNAYITPSGNHYKSQRNAVAGIVNQDNIKDLESRNISLTLIDYNTYSYYVPYSKLKEKWHSIVKKITALPYPMDGIVIKIADREYSKQLGSTKHHPRGQLAYKFRNQIKQSKLIDVVWSFGKQSLTPVGIIRPISFDNITVSKVTFHNLSFLEKHDIMIGDSVMIELAGGVIPHFLSSTPGVNRRSPVITKCPSCNSPLIRDGSKLKCANKDCFETNLATLYAEVKKAKIKGLGKSTLRKLIKNVKVKNLDDILNLKYQEIAGLKGFKEKSATRLYNNIQKFKEGQKDVKTKV